MTTKHTEPSPEAVDDRELMRLLDGELADDLAADVEARLEGDEDAMAKLAGLELVGSLLRELVDDDARGDGIADAVMDRIGDADAEADDGDDDVASEPALPKVEVGLVQPMNDNSRSIYALAAAAAAVAAGLFFYSRSEPESVAELPTAPVLTHQVAALPAPSERPAPATAADDEPEVEIAAVDFGSQSGSVFYISGGKNTAASTAVLWVSDLGE